jgi:AraC family transcriptional regulator
VTSGPTVKPGTPVRVATYPAGASYGPRTSRDYEFVWILSGSATWQLDGPVGREISLQPGQLALARPGHVDSYRWDPTRETVHAYVHFALPDRGPLPPDPEWPLVRSLATPSVLNGLCSYVLELAGQPDESARERTDRMLGVLLEVFVTGPASPPEAALSAPLLAVVDAVRHHWRAGSCAVPVPVLADAAGTSAGHLYRIFRTEYGCGPARALEIIRVAQAATLLQRTNATLAEIARRSGYANPYHFSRRFAAVYGLPPGAFRHQTKPHDPYEPVSRAGLLPLARALLGG